MKKVLVINAGSSTVKFSVFNKEQKEEIANGIVDRIGIDNSYIQLKFNDQKKKKEIQISDHKTGFSLMLDMLKEENVIDDFSEIVKAGHRVVQGGEYFKKSSLVDEVVLNKIKEYSELAPLHNPHNATGIEVMQQILPNIKNIVVFDTEFHQSMPKESYLYPVPYSWYEDHKVRKYGAHGTSHKYVAHEAARLRNKSIVDEKYIICHLGNGASLTAVKDGKSLQTSMGLTPLDGIMMGTRSGTLDPAILPFMCDKLNKTPNEILKLLNHESGMLGISGISNDFRDVEERLFEGDMQAKLGFDLYIARLVEFIGSYYFRLQGIDALIFTAGIGENSDYVRGKIMEKLSFLGIKANEEANKNKELYVSDKNSAFDVMIVPTNEELQIFMETEKF